jgi:murein DD-endopeptidase MepM/ murein hydrolase activator NlpD
MFQLLADFINGILAALKKIGNFQASDLVPDMPWDQGGEAQDVGDIIGPVGGEDDMGGGGGGGWGGRLVTIPENIGATFHATGSPAWIGQWAGTDMEDQHGGIDFRGNEGTDVYAPYAGIVIRKGHYSDSGRFGDYIIMTLADGAEYYSGHLKNVKVQGGDSVKAGTIIGQTNNLNHTHIQLKVHGKIQDFLEYRKNNP